MNSATLGLELKVLQMYMHDHMKEKEIAKFLNISLTTVNKIVADFKSIESGRKI